MKRIHNVKKIVALFLAMLMAATSTAFADWDQYQGNSENNGTSDIGITSRNPSTTTVDLPNNGAWTGVDCEPIISGSTVYVLYNGGTPSGDEGGARLAAVDASSTSTSPKWTVQLDADSANVSQLSTPIVTDSDTLYAATLHYVNDLKGTGTTDWTGEAVSGGRFQFGTGTHAATYAGLVLNGEKDDGYYQPQLVTNLVVASGMNITGTATLTNQETKNTYTLTATGYAGSNLTFYAPENAPLIPVGTYNLEMSITTNQDATITSVQFLTSRWTLHKVTGISSGNVVVDDVATGNGQPNTPIKSDGTALYFGIYEGDRCYYQYSISGKTLTSFAPAGGDDFYYAGAAIQGDNIYFGSESGTLYMRSAADFASTGTSLNLPDTRKIRSSVCLDSAFNTLYLTSYNGLLWRINLTDSGFGTYNYMNIAQGEAKEINRCVSTPVVAKSGLIYVSVYGYTNAGVAKGYVVATRRGEIAPSNAPNIIYNGDIVQSSPVVYSNMASNIDYIYFTTNTAKGTGYCYQCQHTVSSEGTGKVWSVTPSEYSGYALQGFATGLYTEEDEEGELLEIPFEVFGNDSNQIIIVK